MGIFAELADNGLYGCSTVVGARRRKWDHVFDLLPELHDPIRRNPGMDLECQGCQSGHFFVAVWLISLHFL